MQLVEKKNQNGMLMKLGDVLWTDISNDYNLKEGITNDHGFKVLEVNASFCRSGVTLTINSKKPLNLIMWENTKSGNMNLDEDEPSENTL
ncbi:hypothetical protein TNIN_350541 [Trichonephila inaurata madagascariensis]|uniref:Uncharacterized protein n=1 Tax=Trichonephila inaurata madagascariensis TaxID=2747483 RepID=A0A8X6Y5G2_9ARAC|nr:hypothetical protein TNIN_350541 [Trichonephila inaurata madagascariensis]